MNHGASIRSWRSAARKVMVFQRPWGTVAGSLCPRGAHPRKGAISVRVQVSSMKTSRSASTRPWYFVHWARRRATSGRSRSPATTLFFEAELLGMHEVPHRVIVDLQAASSKLGNEPPYSEIAVPDPLRQPNRVVSRNRLRLMTAHLTRLNAAGLLYPLHPTDCCADRDPKLLGCLIAGHPALDRGHDTLAKIQRIRLAHPCWPPTQPAW